MAFIGQRADVIVVEGVTEGDKFRKEVTSHTLTCPECGGTGYYDERGDVICDGCGMMLGGEPVIPTEHGTDDARESESDGSTAGSGTDYGTDMKPQARGLGTTDVPPIPDPSPTERTNDRE